MKVANPEVPTALNSGAVRRLFAWFRWMIIAAGCLPAWTAPVLTRQQVVNGTNFQFSVSGPTNQWLRIEASMDLDNWVPVELSQPGTSASALTLTNIISSDPVFLRAVPTTAGLKVSGVAPTTGRSGETILVEGEFFDAGHPANHSVTIGGVEARVLRAEHTWLAVEVPSNPRSGEVSVRTKDGSAISPVNFSAIGDVDFKVTPASGLNAADYEVTSLFTTNVAITRVGVAINRPTLVFATPKNTNDSNVYLAVSHGQTGPLEISSASTAAAMVFSSVLLSTSDPDVAGPLLASIRTNQAVGLLAKLIDTDYVRHTPLLDDPDFGSTVGAAIRSVLQSTKTTGVASGLKPARTARPLAVSPVESLYPLDADWIEVTRLDENNRGLPPLNYSIQKGQSVTYPYFTPLDWYVAVWQIDSAKAFPEGNEDFNQIKFDSNKWLDEDPPQEFPLVSPEPIFIKVVDAQAFNSVTVPLKSVVGHLFDKAKNALSPEENLVLTNSSAIYLLRAFSPAFSPVEELDFAIRTHPSERNTVLAINLVNAAVELAGTLIDVAGFGLSEREKVFTTGPISKLRIDVYQKELATKLVLEATKKVPNFKEPGDFRGAAADVFKVLLQELADKGRELAVTYAEEHAKAAALQFVAKMTGGVNAALKTFDISGAISQLGLRAYGLTVSSPMESAIIRVGEPFALTIDSISPNPAPVGEQVTLRFHGPRAIGAFDPSRDHVSLEGGQFEDLEFISIQGPDPQGNQTLVVKVPDGLSQLAAGTNQLILSLRGYQGRTNLTITTEPTVAAMTPASGFAATDNFAGSAFPGTQVELQGLNFSFADRFYFTGIAGEVEATSKTGSTGLADVRLSVPAGAVTGRIRISHKAADGSLQTAFTDPFRVLGAPVIVAQTVTHGPVGSTVAFQMKELSANTKEVVVKFTGVATPVGVAVSGPVLSVVAPSGTLDGPITIETPGGHVKGTFSVDPGLTIGSTIDASTGFISPARAFEIAAGRGKPVDDDADVGPGGVSLDPPFEEGDFISPDQHGSFPRFSVGNAFADTIILGGVWTEPVVLDSANSGDTIKGVIGGPVVISGDRITIDGTTKIHAQVLVTGDANRINGVFDSVPGHALVIRGDRNTVGAGFTGNQGDAIRIEGGQLNSIDVSRMDHNTGNGITLTGGASANLIRLGTGVVDGRHAIPGTGNQGHGIALIGDATFNQISTTAWGSSANRGHGILLDGPNVTDNVFTGILCELNQGNGITLTNGASFNRFAGLPASASGVAGYIACNANRGSGFAAFGSGENTALLSATGNTNHGLHLSGVKHQTSAAHYEVEETGFLGQAGNQGAGVRLDRGTSGVTIKAFDIRNNTYGIQVLDVGTSDNDLNLSLRDNSSDGLVMTNASGNRIGLSVTGSGGAGVILSRATNNDVHLDQVITNRLAGVILTDSSSENRFFSSTRIGAAGVIAGNRTGVVLQNGASHNQLTGLTILGSTNSGLDLRGVATDRNQILRSTVRASGTDGIRIADGAGDNLIGGDKGNDPSDPFGLDPYSVDLDSNHDAGIRITGLATAGNTVKLCDFYPRTNQLQAIVIDDGASWVNVISNRFSMPGSEVAVTIGNNSHYVTVAQNLFAGFKSAAVSISNSSHVIVGGSTADGNVFTNQPVGVVLDGAATFACEVSGNQFARHTIAAVQVSNGARGNRIGPGNQITGGAAGVTVTGSSGNGIRENTIANNSKLGVQLIGGSTNNLVQANIIRSNSVGVIVTGDLSRYNSILDNSIFKNSGLGIQLVEGGNNALKAPTITGSDHGEVRGLVTAPDGSVVQVFRDDGDEGEALLGTTRSANGQFKMALGSGPFDLGVGTHLNATVTDPQGNTSPFKSFGPPLSSLDEYAYASALNGPSQLYIVDRNSPPSQPRLLFQDSANDTEPSFSPDGTRIAYTSKPSNGFPDIYIVTVGPTPLKKRLTSNPATDHEPAWLDNHHLLFVSDRGGSPGLFVMDDAGGNVQPFPTPAGEPAWPAVSPDGKRVAYSLKQTDHWQVFVTDPTGSNPRQVAPSTGNDLQPAWSPDGSWIAFSSDRTGNPQIFVAEVDGPQVMQRTLDQFTNTEPVWIPSGDGVIFTSDRSGKTQLYTVSPEGGVERLSISPGIDTHATVGPHN